MEESAGTRGDGRVSSYHQPPRTALALGTPALTYGSEAGLAPKLAPPPSSSALDAPPPRRPRPSFRSLLSPPYFVLSLTLSRSAFSPFSSRWRFSHTYSSPARPLVSRRRSSPALYARCTFCPCLSRPTQLAASHAPVPCARPPNAAFAPPCLL